MVEEEVLFVNIVLVGVVVISVVDTAVVWVVVVDIYSFYLNIQQQ